MTHENTLDSRHPVVRFHRIGAAVIGLLLVVFGVLGYLGSIGFLAVHGDHALGLFWLVLALVLLLSALSARAAAQTTTIVGGLLLVVGLLSMALLHTGANVLGLTIWNVVSGLVIGLVLLTVGLFGRASGQLPQDNPYRRARGGENPMSAVWHDEDLEQEPSDDPEATERQLAEGAGMAAAELAFAEGEATPEQEQRVLTDASRRTSRRRRDNWRRAERDGHEP